MFNDVNLQLRNTSSLFSKNFTIFGLFFFLKFRQNTYTVLVPTPIASVDVILGFRGEYDDVNAVPVVNQITKIVRNLRGTVSEEGIFTEISNDILFVKFSLIGSNKIDVAYRLEQMVSLYFLKNI